MGNVYIIWLWPSALCVSTLWLPPVPWLRKWGWLNQWTWNFGFFERCRFTFAIVQTHQNKVSSYAAVVSFMFVTWRIRGHLLQYTGFYGFVIMFWKETKQLHYCTFGEILKRISCLSEDDLFQCGFVSIYTPTMNSKALPSRQQLCSRQLRILSELLSLLLKKRSPHFSSSDCYSGTPSDRSEWSEP